jgi:hypothetical protein
VSSAASERRLPRHPLLSDEGLPRRGAGLWDNEHLRLSAGISLPNLGGNASGQLTRYDVISGWHSVRPSRRSLRAPFQLGAFDHARRRPAPAANVAYTVFTELAEHSRQQSFKSSGGGPRGTHFDHATTPGGTEAEIGAAAYPPNPLSTSQSASVPADQRWVAQLAGSVEPLCSIRTHSCTLGREWGVASFRVNRLSQPVECDMHRACEPVPRRTECQGASQTKG